MANRVKIMSHLSCIISEGMSNGGGIASRGLEKPGAADDG